MKEVKINLRPATTADKNAVDFVALGTLYDRAFSEERGYEAIAQLLRSNGAWAEIAETPTPEGRIAVGFIVGAVAADEVEVFSIGVDPDWRGLGVGRALLQSFLNHGVETSATAAFLEVAVDNALALKLYEKTGFTEIGKRKGYYRRKNGVRIDAVILKRLLDPPAFCEVSTGDY